MTWANEHNVIIARQSENSYSISRSQEKTTPNVTKKPHCWCKAIMYISFICTNVLCLLFMVSTSESSLFVDLDFQYPSRPRQMDSKNVRDIFE